MVTSTNPSGPYTTVGSFTLPPGKYLVNATLSVRSIAINGTSMMVECFFPVGLASEEARSVERTVALDGWIENQITIPTTANLSGPGSTTLSLGCRYSGVGPNPGQIQAQAYNPVFSAVEVASIN